jgi:tRNA threonylcarbamoyladenosine biosynthesis protein TsaB
VREGAGGARTGAMPFGPVAAGDGSLRFRGMLEDAGIPVEPDGSMAHLVRALCVCRLAAGAPDEAPEAVLPEYLREPDAKPRQ